MFRILGEQRWEQGLDTASAPGDVADVLGVPLLPIERTDHLRVCLRSDSDFTAAALTSVLHEMIVVSVLRDLSAAVPVQPADLAGHFVR